MSKLMHWVRENQEGFTLAELLVVVGIVVGLAAVILPNVGRFTGEGARGALATELASVQTAIDAFGADGGAVDLQDTYTNELLGGTGPIDLTGYLRLPNGATQTTDNYCWDANGTVAQEFGADGVSTACPY